MHGGERQCVWKLGEDESNDLGRPMVLEVPNTNKPESTGVVDFMSFETYKDATAAPG